MKFLFSLLILVFLSLPQMVEGNYDYICFTGGGTGEWSECAEGGYGSWTQDDGCRIYTGTRTQRAAWQWGNTREGCSGRRTFRGSDIRTGVGGNTLDVTLRGAAGQNCYQGQLTESFQQFGYEYDLQCVVESADAEERVNPIDCRTQALGGAQPIPDPNPDPAVPAIVGDMTQAQRDAFLQCLVDDLEEEFVADALIEIGNPNFLEEACQIEQCDPLAPICRSTFHLPYEWHKGEDFEGNDPLVCELDTSIGRRRDGDDDELVIIDRFNLSEISATCASEKISDTEVKTVCEYTGDDQFITVPEGVTDITIKAWGAGGGGTMVQGGNQRGGAAGYATGKLDINSGEELRIIVGESGKTGSIVGTYGGGGAGGNNPVNDIFLGGSGGGLSGVFRGEFNQTNALLVAGGGGGTPGGTFPNVYGGAGGGDTGFDGRVSSGEPAFGGGGTQTAGGAGGPSQGNPGFDGIQLSGGNGGDGNGDGAGGGGGGGGGYFGGGGGAGHDRVVCLDCNLDASAGGGSGYCSNSVTNCELISGDNGGDNIENTAPGNSVDEDYVAGIGAGNEASDGGYGLVVIRWTGDFHTDDLMTEIQIVESAECTTAGGDCIATCPEGTSVLSGGLEWLGTDGTCHLKESLPNENGWIASLAPTNTATTSCTWKTYAVCGIPAEGVTTQKVRQDCDPARSSACTATCADGSFVAGGGVDWMATDGTCHVADSHPGGTSSWYGNLAATNTDTTSCTGAVEAICINPGDRDLNTRIVRDECDAGEASACSVLCPLNHVAIGGGVDWLDTDGTCHITSTVPNPDGWRGGTSSTNTPTSNCEAAVEAVCLPLLGEGVPGETGGFPGCVDNFDQEVQPAGCDPASVRIVDPLDPVGGDRCRMEVCDYAGNCTICEPSPPLKFDDTPPCTAGQIRRPDGTCGDPCEEGQVRRADGTCGDPDIASNEEKRADGTSTVFCEDDDNDCHCILGATDRCRDDGPINCYTSPFHDKCPGFKNIACLLDPISTPGCPIINPCFPARMDGAVCPTDSSRFCARNSGHYSCNTACRSGTIECNPPHPAEGIPDEIYEGSGSTGGGGFGGL